MLKLKPIAARVYLPPDANTFLSTLHHCLKSKNYINLMVGAKQPTPVYLTPEEAENHCRAGASIWKFCSTDSGLRPDIVLVGIGVEVMFEVIYAAAILRKRIPELRVRVINVTDLMILDNEGAHPHALSNEAFENMFTGDRNIHFNYHGYPSELEGLLFGRPHIDRATIDGYMEEGSTTTPFDMMLANHVSRFHVAKAALRGAAKWNEHAQLMHHELATQLDQEITDTKKYILANRQGMSLPSHFPEYKTDKHVQIPRKCMTCRLSIRQGLSRCPCSFSYTLYKNKAFFRPCSSLHPLLFLFVTS